MDALLFGVTFNNRKPVLKLFESDLVLSEIASQMRDLVFVRPYSLFVLSVRSGERLQ